MEEEVSTKREIEAAEGAEASAGTAVRYRWVTSNKENGAEKMAWHVNRDVIRIEKEIAKRREE